jgi:biopolymer transport protein ExbD
VPVTFRCSECTQKLRIEDAFAGKLVSCVRCGAKQRVPLESSPEFAKPKPADEAPKPVPRRPPPSLKPPGVKSRAPQPAEPQPPPIKPPEVKSTEPKSPKPLKPWQPRPVRQEPLPSELLSLREEPKPEEPQHEKPRSEKPPAKTPKRETAPDELSFEALSAIFDEEIVPAKPSSKDVRRDSRRDKIREELPTEARPQEKAPQENEPQENDLQENDLRANDTVDKPATAPDLSGKLLSEEGLAEEELESEVPEYSSPEFEAAPLVVAGSKHFEEGFVPASFDAPQTTYLPEHQLEHPPAAPHAEPSMVPPAQKLDVEELIDMTAMVDIVFFLLIFFLVTSMHSLDSTIPMPAPDPQKGAAKEPQTVAAIDADDSYVVVRIDKNDKITVEGAEVRSERDLLFKLRDLRLAAARPEKLLVIGHGDATHGTAVMILDAGRELGMDQVKLTVQDEEE